LKSSIAAVNLHLQVEIFDCSRGLASASRNFGQRPGSSFPARNPSLVAQIWLVSNRDLRQKLPFPFLRRSAGDSNRFQTRRPAQFVARNAARLDIRPFWKILKVVRDIAPPSTIVAVVWYYGLKKDLHFRFTKE